MEPLKNRIWQQNLRRSKSYQFSYQTNFGIVVFYTGWQPNVTTELPEGSKASNYSLHLRLQVIDSLGDSSLELITAQVFITQNNGKYP